MEAKDRFPCFTRRGRICRYKYVLSWIGSFLCLRHLWHLSHKSETEFFSYGQNTMQVSKLYCQFSHDGKHFRQRPARLLWPIVIGGMAHGHDHHRQFGRVQVKRPADPLGIESAHRA